MKIKLAVAATMAAASVSAHALLLDSLSGPVNWKLTGVTSENAACLALGPGAGCETTWGVGQISGIDSPLFPFNTLWSPSLSGNNDYLAYIIYGIADAQFATGGANGFNIYNVGATLDGASAADPLADGKIHMDVYRKATPFTFTPSTANRTAYNEFTGITDVGSLYLDLVMDPGIVSNLGDGGFNEYLTTLFQNANATSLSGSIQGTGQFYASVGTGTGSGNAKWDTNGYLVACDSVASPGCVDTARSDFSANFTLKPSGITDFPGLINDPINANALPEPGSLALLSGALLGLAGMRRRKSAQ